MSDGLARQVCTTASGDVFALPDRARPAGGVTHRPGCTRAPCACFGIVAAVVEVDESPLELRLTALGELVGSARLLLLGRTLVMVQAASFRASTTEDWAQHHQIVSELLLREAARAADARGYALVTAVEEPAGLLAELGFAASGTLMRREPIVCPGPREASS